MKIECELRRLFYHNISKHLCLNILIISSFNNVIFPSMSVFLENCLYFVSDLSSLVEEFFNIMLQFQWENIVHHHFFSHFINNQFSTSEQFFGIFEDKLPIFHVIR